MACTYWQREQEPDSASLYRPRAFHHGRDVRDPRVLSSIRIDVNATALPCQMSSATDTSQVKGNQRRSALINRTRSSVAKYGEFNTSNQVCVEFAVLRCTAAGTIGRYYRACLLQIWVEMLSVGASPCFAAFLRICDISQRHQQRREIA